MEDNMKDKSVLEILDFVINPEKAHSTPKGISLDYRHADPPILESLDRIVASQDEEIKIIHIHDAAVFSAYFGIPKNEEKRLLWEKLSFDEKICDIKNVFSNGGSTSFTKIL